MTRRKPTTMRIDDWVSHLIHTARDQGEFDRLPGKGKRLPPQSGSWIEDFMRREGLSLPAPGDLALKKQVADLRAALPRVERPEQVRALVAALNQKIAAFNRSGRPSSVAPLWVEDELARWRKLRRAPA